MNYAETRGRLSVLRREGVKKDARARVTTFQVLTAATNGKAGRHQ
jgi:hypothetical protein